MFDIIELNGKKVAELRQIASKLGIARVDKLKKQDLVYSILDEQAAQPNKGKSGKAAPSNEGADNRRKRNKPTDNEESTPSDQPTRGRRTKKEDGKEQGSDDSKSKDQETPKGDKDSNRRGGGESMRERRERRRREGNDGDSQENKDGQSNERGG